MKSHTPPSGYQRIERHDQLFQEKRHDPYQARGKLAEPTVCPQCKAVFEKGRWRWGAQPPEAHQAICPACQREHDHFPAGYVTLTGPFLESHREEILHLVRNHEGHEREEHPLQRIMSMENADGELHIETTDIHLARGIGEALHHAYQGELEYHYNPSEDLLRVHWKH